MDGKTAVNESGDESGLRVAGNAIVHRLRRRSRQPE
jgi:hypothetical protein